MANAKHRGPRALGEILSDLYALRGFAQQQASGQLEDAWNQAVGDVAREHTQIGQIRRGVLTITVGHPALLEELAAFQKTQLLQSLQKALPDAGIVDIRFRIGDVGRVEPTQDKPLMKDARESSEFSAKNVIQHQRRRRAPRRRPSSGEMQSEP